MTRLVLAVAALWVGAALADVVVVKISQSPAAADPKATYWAQAPVTEVSLMAQPMVVPRPAVTTTAQVKVQAVHDGKTIAFRLTWADSELSAAGRLGEFSDAAAIQFPAGNGEAPPVVMMGSKDHPVHIFHWRAQYQRDLEQGKPTMKQLYPNVSIDMYPMEFESAAASNGVTERDRERYSPGRSEGNPQSYAKSGVDEIIAEGFSTSSVQQGHQSAGRAVWENGQWTLVIARALALEGGSVLAPGQSSFVAFAIWQGGAQEVGSRKSVTMTWTALQVAAR